MTRSGFLLLVAFAVLPVASAYTVDAKMSEDLLITSPPGGGAAHLNPRTAPLLNVSLAVGCEEIRTYGDPMSSMVHFQTVFDLPDDIYVDSTDGDEVISVDRGPCSLLGTERLTGSKTFRVYAGPFVPALYPQQAEVDLVPADDGDYPLPIQTIPSSDGPAEFTVTVAFTEYLQATTLDSVYDDFHVELPIHLEGWSSGPTWVSWRLVDGPDGLFLPIDVILGSNETVPRGSADTKAVLPFTRSPDGPYQWVLEAIIRPASAMNDESSYERVTPLQVTLSLDEEEMASHLKTFREDTYGPQPASSVGLVPGVLVVGLLTGLARRR